MSDQDETKQLAAECAALRRDLERARLELRVLREAHTRLREADEQLRTLLENTDDFILFSDAKGMPFAFNSAYARIMKELLGIEMRPGLQPHKHLADPEQVKVWDELLARVAAGERFRIEYEHRVVGAVPRYFDISFAPIVVDGEVVGHSEYTREVTAARQAERERAALERRLVQAQKLELAAQLAGGMAHDFNNVLGIIRGIAEVELARGPSATAPASLRRIVAAVERGEAVTTKLLAFARREPLDVRTTTFLELAGDVTDALQASHASHVRVKATRRHERPLHVRADYGQLLQALLNLCTNACEAMPDGGSLTIDATAEELDATACAGRPGLVPGTYCRIRIADTGPGIPVALRDRVFEPFFTTKPAARGVGLGLPVALGIVRRHGGHVEIDETPPAGCGTSVSVFLPLAPAAAAAPAAPTPERGVTEAPATILLIDDDEDFLEMAAAALSLRGYRVLVAPSGPAALALLDRPGPSVDLVILDMIMPEMDGTEVFEALRRRDPQLRVLIASGYSREGRAAELLAAGAVGFLQKPFALEALYQAVAAALPAAPEVQAG